MPADEVITLNVPGVLVRASGTQLSLDNLNVPTVDAPRVLRIEASVVRSTLRAEQSFLKIGSQIFHGIDDGFLARFFIVSCFGLPEATVRDRKRRVLFRVVACAARNLDL